MIPSAYKKVSYLQSTGVQYIETNIVPNINQKYVLDFQMLNTQNNYYIMYSSETGKGSFSLYANTSGSLWAFLPNASANTTGPTTYRKTATLDIPRKRLTYGTAYKDFSAPNANNFPTNVVTLFKYNTTFAPIKFYSLKCTEGSDTIAELTPVVRKADEKTGLYDEVTQTFFPNLGTAEFITDYVPGEDDETEINAYIGSTKISKVMLGSTEISNIL